MSGVLQYIIILLYSFERRVLASRWEILEALLILSKMTLVGESERRGGGKHVAVLWSVNTGLNKTKTDI